MVDTWWIVAFCAVHVIKGHTVDNVYCCGCSDRVRVMIYLSYRLNRKTQGTLLTAIKVNLQSLFNTLSLFTL